MARFTTVADLKRSLDISGNAKDAVLGPILDGAERFIERRARHTFAPDPPLVVPQSGPATDTGNPVTKTFTTRGRRVIRIPDLRTPQLFPNVPEPIVNYGGMDLARDFYDFYDDASTQAEPATEVSLYQYSQLPAAARFSLAGGGIPRQHDLTIRGKWGWYPAPEDIVEATLALAARRYKERDASYADTVQTADGGMLAFFRQLPAAVQATVDGYRPVNLGLV